MAASSCASTSGKLAGAKLRPEKGLNFPDTDLGLDPLTDKDRQDLDFIVANADLVGHSFVQTAAHVASLQAELAARAAPTGGSSSWSARSRRRAPSPTCPRSSCAPPAASPSR